MGNIPAGQKVSGNSAQVSYMCILNKNHIFFFFFQFQIVQALKVKQM